MFRWFKEPRSESGQVLVIVAAGMIVMVAMVGLVIDGGHAWGQQRGTQNAADSVSKAGTTVIQQYLSGATVTDGDVGCAVASAASDNSVTLESVEYTNHEGALIGASVGACNAGAGSSIPSGAQGVKATGTREFDTFLGSVVGMPQFTSRADAISVVGRVEAVCPASAGCGVLPVTFPRSLDTCDGTNHRVVGDGAWEPLDPEVDTLDASNLAILPLCSTGPGSVGWLNFGCGNLSQMITNPCNQEIPIPAWIQTQTGNVNNLEGVLQDYTGSQPGVPEEADATVLVPIHDWTCRDPLAHSQPIQDCPGYINGNSPDEWTSNGNNLYYHIPYWAGIKIDGAYTGGNDPQCNQAPGSPPAGGNGATGCIKGWFVEIVEAPGSVSTGVITPGEPVLSAVVLIN
jgi:hypothetical protein